jgi:hypothetical protein
MLVEGALVAFGLAGGYRLGKGARDLYHETAPADGHAGPPATSERASTSGASSGASSDDPPAILTALLVGESGVGKSLFCARVASVEGVGRETLPRTVAPNWHRVDLGVRRKIRVQLLDTPGRAGLDALVVPFYRQVHAVVLMFDVGSLASFEALKTRWYQHVQQQRMHVRGHHEGSCVVLAHVIDERRERQVKRREASAWCTSVGLPFFETHQSDSFGWQQMMAHLAGACLRESRGVRAEDVLPALGHAHMAARMEPGLVARKQRTAL